MGSVQQACAVLLLSGTAAFGGGLPDDFLSAEGWISLGASDRLTGADAFIVSDATLRLTYEGLTAEIGVFGRADALDTPHETYGAVGVYLTPNLHVSAGVPRPAYDRFALSALERRLPSLSVDRVATSRSAATQGAMFANWLPYGIALNGETEAFRFALSAHHAETPGETVIGAGFATEMGRLHLSGAIESAGDNFNVKAQAAQSFGRIAASVSYFAPGAAGLSDVLELAADVAAFDRLTLAGVVQAPLKGGGVTGGVTAHYSLSDRTSLSLGIGREQGNDTFFTTYISFEF